MALKLQKITNSGVNVEYWKIINTFQDWINSKIHQYIVGGYINQQARNEGRQPVETKVIRDNIDLEVEDDILKKCYENLKIKPEWSGSEDV